MATIGTFTKSGEDFTGTVKTLALNVKAKIARAEKENDKAPDFRIYAGATEFGAAWRKTSGAGREYLSVKGSAATPVELKHWSMHSFGAVFCEMRVNTVTGELRVSRILGSYDCGRILNAKTARSQFRGGIIMGLGLAMMEETAFDERNGRIMNPSLAEYHFPVHMDVPEIDVMWTDIPDPFMEHFNDYLLMVEVLKSFNGLLAVDRFALFFKIVFLFLSLFSCLRDQTPSALIFCLVACR